MPTRVLVPRLVNQTQYTKRFAPEQNYLTAIMLLRGITLTKLPVRVGKAMATLILYMARALHMHQAVIPTDKEKLVVMGKVINKTPILVPAQAQVLALALWPEQVAYINQS